MRLPISENKCWVWGTERKLRQVAKSIRLDGQAIALRAKLATVVKHLQKAEAKLNRILAKKIKAILVGGAAMPSCTYGTEITWR